MQPPSLLHGRAEFRASVSQKGSPHGSIWEALEADSGPEVKTTILWATPSSGLWFQDKSWAHIRAARLDTVGL